MFKRKGGGGSKAFCTMLKKTALFLRDGFPYYTSSQPICLEIASLSPKGRPFLKSAWSICEELLDDILRKIFCLDFPTRLSVGMRLRLMINTKSQ